MTESATVRTTGESGNWQENFKISRHPLAGCLERHVNALELTKADRALASNGDGPEYYYSRSTYAFLADAAGFGRNDENFAKAGFERILDLDGLLCALSSKLSENSLGHGINLSSTPFGRRPPIEPDPPKGSSLSQGNGATALNSEVTRILAVVALDPGVVEALSLASSLASDDGTGEASVDLALFVFALIATLGKYAPDLDRSLDASLDSVQVRQVTFLRYAIGSQFAESTRRRCKGYADWVETSAGWLVSPSFQAPDYRADSPIADAGDDLLGFRDEARAAAELICLKNSGALALGVFGDWGSGKSSFLLLMENEVRNLCAAVRDTAASFPALKSPFFENAKCVRFNVWEYNDSQLLLSLANRTFDTLNNKRVEEEIAKELKGAVLNWRNSSKGVHGALQQAEQDKQAAINAIVAANKAAHTDEQNAWTRALQAFNTQLKTNLASDANATSTPRALAFILRDQVEAGIRDVNIWSLMTDLRLLRSAPGRVWGAMAGFAAIAGLFAMLTFQAEKLPLASVSALVVGTLPLLVHTKKLAAIAADYARDLSAAERKRRAAMRDAELDRAQADQEIDRKQRELAALETKLDRFAGGSRDQRYDYFLSESSLLQQLSDEAGLTSRVRRAFEVLNNLIRDKPKSRAPEAEQPSDDEAATEKKQSVRARSSLPEKIVFFIDELDRCRAKQVVRMLEAIHLLLAFENFTVVVAVDSRWLEGALLTVFERELASTRRKDDIVHEYIEKIIQVPIRVRGLTFEPGQKTPETHAPRGTYVDLIRALTPQAPVEDGRGHRLPGGSGDGSDTRVVPLDIAPVSVPKADARAAAERAILTPEEVSDLELMGPFVGTSPRTVKRFVNVYRLVRAMQTGADFEAFVKGPQDGSGSNPLYRAILLCLAVQCGMKEGSVHYFRKGVEASDAPADLAFADFLNHWSDTGERNRVLEMLNERLAAGGAAQLREAMRRSERFAFWTGAKSVDASQTEIGMASG